MGADPQGSVEEAGLSDLLRAGRIHAIQVQLAANLGHRPARAAGLPKLRLRLGAIQWAVALHKGLPKDVQRVLRSAIHSVEYGLPPRLSVTWGADCAGRALPVFEARVPGDDRPRRAIETARAWARGQTDAAGCARAACAANDAVEAARAAAQAARAKPKRGGPMGQPCYDSEAAAYAAREAADAGASPEEPHWLWAVSDHPAIHAGHAANLAALASPDRRAEHRWQRQRLIELILTWDPETWNRWRLGQ